MQEGLHRQADPVVDTQLVLSSAQVVCWGTVFGELNAKAENVLQLLTTAESQTTALFSWFRPFAGCFDGAQGAVFEVLPGRFEQVMDCWVAALSFHDSVNSLVATRRTKLALQEHAEKVLEGASADLQGCADQYNSRDC